MNTKKTDPTTNLHVRCEYFSGRANAPRESRGRQSVYMQVAPVGLHRMDCEGRMSSDEDATHHFRSSIQMHVCTPSCAFDRSGDTYTCSISGRAHVCDATCGRLTTGVHGRYCELTHKCHDGHSSPSMRRARVSPSGHTVNQKDRFFHNAKNVICCISQTSLDEAQVDTIAMKCLSIFSQVKENHVAFQKIHAISHEYLVLSLLYMLSEGLCAEGVQVVPRIESLEPILPSKCDLHKCLHGFKKRTSKKLKRYNGGGGDSGVVAARDSQDDLGMRKRTLTNTSRSVCEALKIWLDRGGGASSPRVGGVGV